MKAQVKKGWKKKDELFDIYKNAIAETNPTMANEFLDFFVLYGNVNLHCAQHGNRIHCRENQWRIRTCKKPIRT